MSKAVVKLFRDPKHAAKAVQDLLAKGFKADELGILGKAEAGHEAVKAVGKKPSHRELPGVGQVVALGPFAQDEENPLKTLELPEDVLGYYKTGLKVGGVLVSVHPQGKDGAEARKLLHRAEVSLGEKAGGGFPRAERMTASNPIDAKMTGDFRRY